MKTVSTPIANEAAATQNAWVEIYDIYLKAAITTPWGTTNILRLCTLGVDFAFFTPTSAPEATGTQGTAATYSQWPIKRQVVKSSADFTDQKMQITASNVTSQWAQMLADVDWYDVAVMIRQTSPNLVGATNTDCVTLFSGVVDSIKIDNQTITLSCSNSLAQLTRVLPSENMHASCRFRWADDLCTQIRFKAANYKAKTVGSSSTKILVKSAGLTEDLGNSASYGTDLVDALADAAITTSSERPFLDVTVKSANGFLWIVSGNYVLQIDQKVKFVGSAPTNFVVGTWYYVLDMLAGGWHVFVLATTPGGPTVVAPGSAGYFNLVGEVGYEGFQVKTSKTNHWEFSTDADWGTVDNAYYVIPDAQAGLKNAALTPYIQFDFGSAKTPRLWRLSSVPGLQSDQRVRVIQFFSSSDAATWAFEGYFQMPNAGGTLFDCFLPAASTKRYWRICVRSRWSESLYKVMFYKVQAYENGRHWWRDGRVTFDAATATVALRNFSAKVLGSYAGEVAVEELPATPASGDTLVIERGCARNFNACCERGNIENYGGFDDLPTQTVIR